MTNIISEKFLGSNTGKGFKSFYDDLLYGSGYCDPRQSVYIIKGGPGTGKSTFIKKVASMLEKSDCDIEMLLCSGDVKSLDGVTSKTGGITVVDGTNPHAIEPVCAGVHENIINLGDFWSRDILKHYADRIEKLTEKKKLMYKKAYHYLAAANEIYKERNGIVNRCIDFRKMKLYGLSVADELIPEKAEASSFGIKRRAFATAVTAEGVYGTVPGAGGVFPDGWTVCCINSALCVSCAPILDIIAERAVNCGYDTDIYYCGFDSEKAEHIVIPELNTAVVTSNEYHLYQKDNISLEILPEGFFKESVSVSREKCMDYDIGYAKIRFDELLERAFRALQMAGEYHHLTEDYYIEAMDFKSLNDYADYMLDEMSKVIRENVFG
ncbi:MAG: hypothetical protein E7384_04675 [Ruminococcaceae bacterium]|nr:hypothetical protein [Oscillospiraceae bacterium]